jgi:hypothetical protein
VSANHVTMQGHLPPAVLRPRRPKLDCRSLSLHAPGIPSFFWNLISSGTEHGPTPLVSAPLQLSCHEPLPAAALCLHWEESSVLGNNAGLPTCLQARAVHLPEPRLPSRRLAEVPQPPSTVSTLLSILAGSGDAIMAPACHE